MTDPTSAANNHTYEEVVQSVWVNSAGAQPGGPGCLGQGGGLLRGTIDICAVSE